MVDLMRLGCARLFIFALFLLCFAYWALQSLAGWPLIRLVVAALTVEWAVHLSVLGIKHQKSVMSLAV